MIPAEEHGSPHAPVEYVDSRDEGHNVEDGAIVSQQGHQARGPTGPEVRGRGGRKEGRKGDGYVRKRRRRVP